MKFRIGFQKTLIVVFLSLLFISPVSAVELGGGLLKNAQEASGYEVATRLTFAERLGQVVQVALSFVGIIFLALTVYAGFLWMTARGESDKIDKAKEILKASIIGLVITLGAYSIAAFIVPAIMAVQGTP